MSENVRSIINGMEQNPKSFIGKHVSADEATKILQAAGDFIRHHLLERHNVWYPNIGTFALFRYKLPVSHHPLKFIISQKPVFQLSHSLAYRFQLRWARIQYEVSLPEKELNPSAIAVNTQIARSKVVLTMNELITFIERRLHAKENVELPICGVGTLRIVGEEHRMEFNKQFLKEATMDDAMHVLEDD
ncbi:HU-CCDC81_euk_2 domain-containing protein [Trichonephila inaurata madagascariensis]|uniref:HU-CCDC81_euk_2 domain-containing protein n=1 Tax=Trichonephila inaurata madagascariensis TaxID=2747483 RepID=A0A8X6WQ22_9ARAC|nr:HU-CCDC81_euk_2 domain-containing protein [Trichonephila inaurata madagascariensis]